MKHDGIRLSDTDFKIFAVSKSCKHSTYQQFNIRICRFTSEEMISCAELKAIEDACELLSPIESVTVEISGEKYVTCSKIIPIDNCLMVTINRLIPKTEVSASLKQNILNQIKRRFYSEKSNIEKNSFFSNVVGSML